jgi:IMP dehydrogenase
MEQEKRHSRKAKQRSGHSQKELFKRGTGLTYDDFRILDTIYTDIEERDIDLSTTIGKGIVLKTPIIASPMDTVSNAQMCIAIANMGGIGCIHMNYKKPDNTPDIDTPTNEIMRVKRNENGFIETPITISPDQTIDQAINTGKNNKFGIVIETFPVVDKNGLLAGLLQKQDYSKTIYTGMKVSERMVERKDLIVGKLGISLAKANKMLWDNHLLVLPIIDKNNKLESLVTRSDIDKNERYPLATKDENKRLRVLFATETRPDTAYERLKRGFAAGADGCIIDTSQGYTKYEKEIIAYIIKHYPEKLIIGGNISTIEAAIALENWGLDAARIGQGSGSICITALAIGISRAGATSVYDCSREIKRMIRIADGGLKNVGDILKAMSLGANAVMLGNMLAGTDEAPGKAKYNPDTGEYVKEYRGMGSKEANTMGIRGYNKLPQGVSGYVPYKGPMDKLITLYRDGIISGMKVLNCRTIKEFQNAARNGLIRYELNTPSSTKEMGASVKEK